MPFSSPQLSSSATSVRKACLSYVSMIASPKPRERRDSPSSPDGSRMLVLGIETSCDETSVAVLDGDGRVLSNVVSSQLAAHAPYGGVVPEIAARAHLENLPVTFERALSEAGIGVPLPISSPRRRDPV